MEVVAVKRLLLIPLLGIFFIAYPFIKPPEDKPFVSQSAPTLAQLNKTISKAQTYYEGLYVDLGSEGAVVAEYYPKIKYTMRHATIGAYYYYDYIGDASRSAKLGKVIKENGFNPDYDQHSFIWKYYTNAPTDIIYTSTVYRDCSVKLPHFTSIAPYRSKVCSLGNLGVNAYILSSKLDSFSPMVNTLQEIEQNKKVDTTEFEKRFNSLGFGIPVCMINSCSSTASTIRSAHFGELALRLNKRQYADTTAHYLVKAQNKDGAIYTSYDKDGKRKSGKSAAYLLVDLFLNEKSGYKGDIVTNAETMNNALAFLMHYRCDKYGVGCANDVLISR